MYLIPGFLKPSTSFVPFSEKTRSMAARTNKDNKDASGKSDGRPGLGQLAEQHLEDMDACIQNSGLAPDTLAQLKLWQEQQEQTLKAWAKRPGREHTSDADRFGESLQDWERAKATFMAQAAEHPKEDSTARDFFSHSSAKRVNTDTVMAKSLKQQYPNLELVITPARTCNLIAYAQAGLASFETIGESSGKNPESLSWDLYVAPARRLDGAQGGIAERPFFEKYLYKWRGLEFIIYLVDGRDGSQNYPSVINYYILTPTKDKAQLLILEVGRWGADMHGEILVFDGGYWQKSGELFNSIMKASWDDVILEPTMKQAVIDDHLTFFTSRETYTRLKVPWKRGIIYHGPPGNGKTISIKATMHMLYNLKPAVPTLYVRSLSSFSGPEYSTQQIFAKAREFAPCYLVFEDLDSLVTDSVRSYFLNEVDGLKNNDGVFMVGSTNHLDRLDPGISKRPSRFDRKYYFPDPNLKERILYCRYWQSKLSDNKDIEFPNELCNAIAATTDDFSFAYIQEAFVAALLSIAQKSKKPGKSDEAGWTEDLGDGWVGILGGGDADGDLEKLVLWAEIKKQIAILREGMEEKQKVQM
ncbi:P-loop containing nucleoside triphosphate hydrolase protein [Pseudomassariella vexata]|uniref:p-loop containing nucleoside triphosphate hydrolase protein n=1 Tax=Pseudomassariella vexata TaxID=1141098 RepID=A0A1Y2DIS1_9PEZI|nr:P-loop containing nucleoside triphosphate hydrolase protein [Pseudomassariella vexata]ORY59127.1 P-loop containing nucleoside triphosphate hydrolase protein [Pseudomassariella vexata]